MKKCLKLLMSLLALLVVIPMATATANVSANRRIRKPRTVRRVKVDWTLRTVPKFLRNTTWYRTTKSGKYDIMKFTKTGFYHFGYFGRHAYRSVSYLHPENLSSDRIPKSVFSHKTLDWFSAVSVKHYGYRWFCTSGYYGCGGSEYRVDDHRHQLVETTGAGFYPYHHYYSSKRLANRNR